MPAPSGETSSELRSRARAILRRLSKVYPDARCALDFTTPLELLVATILSAQCTDERVNMVTPALFAKYRSARDYASATQAEMEADIHSIGMFRRKAYALREACAQIHDTYGGEVPSTMEELLALPGVARKTANVVLGNAFGLPTGVVVDTHVSRLAHRMGLTDEVYREKVEAELMDLWPKSQWVNAAHVFILHGRQVCVARKPLCTVCAVADLCPKLSAPKPK